MRNMAVVMLCGAVCGMGCFANPQYVVGLAVQSVSPNDEALESSTQLDVLGRVVFDGEVVEVSYGKRKFGYTRVEGVTYSGDIEFAPLAISLQHLFGEPASQLRVGLGLGVMALTGARENISGVSGIDAGIAWKLILGLQYVPTEAFALALEIPYEFNTQDVTLEKPGYQGVNLDAPVVRLSAAYVF